MMANSQMGLINKILKEAAKESGLKPLQKTKAVSSVNSQDSVTRDNSLRKTIEMLNVPNNPVPVPPVKSMAEKRRERMMKAMKEQNSAKMKNNNNNITINYNSKETAVVPHLSSELSSKKQQEQNVSHKGDKFIRYDEHTKQISLVSQPVFNEPSEVESLKLLSEGQIFQNRDEVQLHIRNGEQAKVTCVRHLNPKTICTCHQRIVVMQCCMCWTHQKLVKCFVHKDTSNTPRCCNLKCYAPHMRLIEKQCVLHAYMLLNARD